MYFGQAAESQNSVGAIAKYDRCIRYLDYMENGQRSRGAGFVKMERRDNRCNISLQVNGLYRKDHFTRPLLMMEDDGEKELCKLQLADGGIKIFLEGLDCANMGGQGLEYERLTGLRIPISEGKEIQCIWGTRLNGRVRDESAVKEDVQRQEAPEEQAPKEQAPKEQAPKEQAREEKIPSAQNRDAALEDVKAPIQEVETWDLRTRSEIARSVSSQDAAAPDMAEPEEPTPDIQAPDPPRQSVSERQAGSGAFREDKWEQLWAIYPHIHPFSDEREYISFGLSDFVVLPARYYKLVNNSFLLHGFYNFHHLILTKVNGRNGVRYFIGVPGNLYQTERETAIMFGFEHFECDAEPAGRGDFGYYLIPVEL